MRAGLDQARRAVRPAKMVAPSRSEIPAGRTRIAICAAFNVPSISKSVLPFNAKAAGAEIAEGAGGPL